MNLKFVQSKRVSRNYSEYNKHKSISEVDMVRTFRYHIRDTINLGAEKADTEYLLKTLDNLNGYISSNISFGANVAFMDIDYPDFKDLTVQKLKELGYAYQVIESSPNRYWIIVDFISSKKRTADFIAKFDGVDPKYISFSKEVGMVLRAFPRGGFIPEICEGASGSILFNRFVSGVKEYWDKTHISWMIQEYTISAI